MRKFITLELENEQCASDYFPRAAISKYYKLSGLNNINSCSQSWRPDVQDQAVIQAKKDLSHASPRTSGTLLISFHDS